MAQLFSLGVSATRMKFIVSRGDTNNPEFLGVVIPPSTPGFKHARIFPKGFRFEVTDPKLIQQVRQGQFTIDDDGSQKSTVEIRKIDAEVSSESTRLKNAEDAKRAEAAREKSKRTAEKIKIGVAITLVGAAIIAWIAILADYISRWFHS